MATTGAILDKPVSASATKRRISRLDPDLSSERIAAAAALVRAVHERTAAFAMVLREAAPSDDQIVELLHATRARQREDVAAGLALLVGRPPTTVETDELWALLSPELYILLVDEAGWKPAAYERWVATTLARVVPRS